jgi:hypothetical protein
MILKNPLLFAESIHLCSEGNEFVSPDQFGEEGVYSG